MLGGVLQWIAIRSHIKVDAVPLSKVPPKASFIFVSISVEPFNSVPIGLGMPVAGRLENGGASVEQAWLSVRWRLECRLCACPGR